MKNDKKIALLLIEGMGTFSENKLNPYLAYNSSNIKKIYREYTSYFLKTNLDSENRIYRENDIVSLINSYSSSKDIRSMRELLVEDQYSFKNKLEQSLYYCKNHLSGLHLVVIYSNDKKLFDQEVFKKTIKFIKEYGLNKVYLHLFVDNSKTIEEIEIFTKEFEQMSRSRFYLSSITGANNLFGKDKNLVDIYKLFKGKANNHISAIGHINIKNLNSLDASKIVNQNYNIGLLNDFDCILFFNHKVEIFDKIIRLFLYKSKHYPKDKKLFQIKVISLYETYDNIISENILSLLSVKTAKENIFSTVSMYDLSQEKIMSDSDRKYLLTSLNGENELFKNEKLLLISSKGDLLTDLNNKLNHFKNRIIKGDSNLIVTVISEIRKASSFADYKNMIELIGSINKHIAVLERTVIKNNVILIIASPFSGSDKFLRSETLSNKVNIDNIKLDQVPFIIVGEKFRNFNKIFINKFDIMNMIINKNTFFDATATILDLLNIDKPEGFIGESLINV